MSTEKECTLEDINFYMDYHESCSTCGEGDCHGAAYTEDKHYWIHVLGKTKNGPFIVTIIDTIGDEPKIVENIPSNHKCAVYLRDNFNFTCE